MPSLADRLLDAQVDFFLAELSGERLDALVSSVVDDVFEVAATLTLGEVVDREHGKALVRTVAARAAESPLVPEAADSIVSDLYAFDVAEEHLLGDVVDRDAVDALVTKVLAMRQFHDRVLERLTESPTVATLMSTFASRLVGDLLAQNRARAEKVPGMSSLFSIGTSAASRMKSVGDQLLGDVTGKSAAYTLKMTNGTIRDALRDEQLHAAVMELWDLHADEPVSALRSYLSQQDLGELLALVQTLVSGVATSEFTGLVLDECVEVFFDDYGGSDLATLLEDLGVERADVAGHVSALAAPVIEASHDELAARIRARLEPFYRSAEVTAILG